MVPRRQLTFTVVSSLGRSDPFVSFHDAEWHVRETLSVHAVERGCWDERPLVTCSDGSTEQLGRFVEYLSLAAFRALQPPSARARIERERVDHYASVAEQAREEFTGDGMHSPAHEGYPTAARLNDPLAREVYVVHMRRALLAMMVATPGAENLAAELAGQWFPGKTS